MKYANTPSLAVLFISAIAVSAFACTNSAEPTASTQSSETASESGFIQTAEAKTNEAAGLDRAETFIVTTDEPIDAPTEIELEIVEEIDRVEIKDVPIVAVDTTASLEANENVQVSFSVGYADWERRLTEIWDESIDGVVLINLGNTVFPGSGTGAGWFWDDQGHIVTNYHVVRPTTAFITPTSIIVETIEGEQFEAELIGGDHISDIAVIKIDADESTYHPLPIGDSARLRPGMAAIALGHPFGIEQAFSMTHGIISGLSRSIQSEASTIPIPAVIQTDADMNPGNSGGPLLNSAGEVVGVNTQIRSVSNVNSGVGFATPINLVRRVVNSLIEDGQHEYSLIGINSLIVTPTLAKQLDFDEDQKGLLITSILPDGPADEAGIHPDTGTFTRTGPDPNGDGDVIVRIDNVAIDELYDLRSYIMLNTSPGDEIVIEVLRGDKIIPISLTLGAWGDQFN